MLIGVVTLRRTRLYVLPHRCGFALIVTLCVIVGFASAAMAQTPFYRAPPSAVVGAPGTLVRQEPIDGAPLGAMAYRVLYRSTGLDDKPILVSGIVIVPQGPSPPGGRPIVAWAHPTSGIVSRCAPSLAIFIFQQIQGLRAMVERGYVVAATDYPGLGAPGPHPYLVGVSEARAVIELGARCGHFARRGRRDKVRGLGPFARRAGRSLYRNDREELCTRTCASRRRCCCACHKSCDLDERRHRIQSAAGTSRP